MNDVSGAATYHAPLALLPGGWAHDVEVDVDAFGTIVRVDSGADDANSATARSGRSESGGQLAVTRLSGALIPGMPNVHSHAFQRALAGQTERRSRPDDSFWTWREAMYALAERLDPDDLEAIATFLYIEMLKAGYTSVAEFHYVHRPPSGGFYSNRTELAERILSAANGSGIGLTLLPVLYTYGGFGKQPPSEHQRRFILDTDEYVGLWNELAESHFRGIAGESATQWNCALGVAAHSLRAVDPKQLATIVAHVTAHRPNAPIHIHIAEQQREVDDALVAFGRRPVAWLLDNVHVDSRWCLVHATHLDERELERLAASGAIAGLCPTTEANLGDGIFPAVEYTQRKGVFGIGSDGHSSVDVAEELRWLEYGQRLLHQRRALLCDDTTLSVGEFSYRHALAGGAAAVGRPVGQLAAGYRADLLVLRDSARNGDDASASQTLLDRLIFGGGAVRVNDVAVGGHWVVRDGRHTGEEAAARRYRDTLTRLMS